MSADEWAWEQNLDCDSTSAQVVVDILNTLLARPEPPKALLARCYVFRIRQVAAERAPISCQLVEDLVQLDEIADPEADPDELPHIVDAASLAPSGEVAALVGWQLVLASLRGEAVPDAPASCSTPAALFDYYCYMANPQQSGSLGEKLHDALRAAGGLSATGPNPAVVEALSKEYPKAELVQQLGAYAAQARRALGDTMLQRFQRRAMEGAAFGHNVIEDMLASPRKRRCIEAPEAATPAGCGDGLVAAPAAASTPATAAAGTLAALGAAGTTLAANAGTPAALGSAGASPVALEHQAAAAAVPLFMIGATPEAAAETAVHWQHMVSPGSGNRRSSLNRRLLGAGSAEALRRQVQRREDFADEMYDEPARASTSRDLAVRLDRAAGGHVAAAAASGSPDRSSEFGADHLRVGGARRAGHRCAPPPAAAASPSRGRTMGWGSPGGEVLDPTNTPQRQRAPAAGARRQRCRWTVEETEELAELVNKYGEGNWAQMEANANDILTGRTQVDMKDKWRNMKRAEARGGSRRPVPRREPLADMKVGGGGNRGGEDGGGSGGAENVQPAAGAGTGGVATASTPEAEAAVDAAPGAENAAAAEGEGGSGDAADTAAAEGTATENGGDAAVADIVAADGGDAENEGDEPSWVTAQPVDPAGGTGGPAVAAEQDYAVSPEQPARINEDASAAPTTADGREAMDEE